MALTRYRLPTLIATNAADEPRTIFKWTTGTNSKTILRGVRVVSNGVDPTQPERVFDIASGATNNGTSDDATADLLKDPGATGETIQMGTVRKNFTSTEPAGTMVSLRKFSCPAMGGGPDVPIEPLVMLANTAYSFRLIDGAGATIWAELEFEE